jgi:hypothetical protein
VGTSNISEDSGDNKQRQWPETGWKRNRHILPYKKPNDRKGGYDDGQKTLQSHQAIRIYRMLGV